MVFQQNSAEMHKLKVIQRQDVQASRHVEAATRL
jgi:hypothetical protein